MLLPLLGLPLATAKAVPAQMYTLTDLYQGTNFFDSFSFFTGPDPTQGWVQYVNRTTAQQNGLIDAAEGPVYVGVDYTTKLYVDGPAPGRQSVRLTSNKAYNASLIIGDFEHTPGGICGTWPAFWTFGPNWPYSGEIDIMEGQNGQTSNLMSLHTGANCTIAGEYETGTLENSDCYQYSPTEYGSGCGVSDGRPASWGKTFNKHGGGVYAVEWTNEYIRIFFFPRSKIPRDITMGQPNPAKWGKPSANFYGGCDIPSHFVNHNIIFDNTFCGSWAGPAFETYPEWYDIPFHLFVEQAIYRRGANICGK